MAQVLLFGGRSFEAHEIAGVDEAGRGCLAGPVVAGACILPVEYDLPWLNDSKQLSEARRETLYPLIREQAVAWGVGVAWPWEIDAINILQATFRAMSRAVRAMKVEPRFLRIDGDKLIPRHALQLDIPRNSSSRATARSRPSPPRPSWPRPSATASWSAWPAAIPATAWNPTWATAPRPTSRPSAPSALAASIG